MRVICANCRARFSPADLDFIIQATGMKKDSSEGLIALLSEPETRDKILDDPRVLHAMLEWKAGLLISQHLYFYVLVRHVFRQAGIDDREIADYVASLLSDFSVGNRMHNPEEKGPSFHYLVDILKELRDSDPEREFILRTHLGNYALFLSGLFLKWIETRSVRKGAPDVEYYESLGVENFRNASGQKIAESLDLSEVLLNLSQMFTNARRALNEMSDRLVYLKEIEPSVIELFESLDHH